MSTSRLNAAQSAAVAELLRIAPVADRLGELFAAAGHELYLVGGSVRDALLGRLRTRPGLHHLGPAGRDRGAAAPVLAGGVDHRQGVRHDRLQGRDAGDASWVIEVTTFRSDAYAEHSRKPAVVFGDTLDGDLVRRDFTVNAMAVSLPDKELRRPVRRAADLARG